MPSSRNLKLFFLCLAILTPFLIRNNSKNYCTSYFDYFLINFGGDCHYNPDVELSALELIRKYTGDVQVYNITTTDGYVLSMFRIFRKNPVGVIMLQPPISTGSMAYLSDGPHSIAIALWNKGYDVWLSNHRGSAYSRGHINLTDSESKFWDFSFHEIALNDLEPQFEIISQETKSKIVYIGYSMGGTEALIYSSLKPKDAEKYIHSYVLIAPLSVMKHFSSPLKYIFYLKESFKNFFGFGEFFTFEFFRWSAYSHTITPFLVNLGTSVLMGWTPYEMDPALYPYVFIHHGKGMSNKVISHFGQIFSNNSQFMFYNYGQQENKLIYGSEEPPVYPLQNVKRPVYIVYGDKDELSTPEDIEILCKEHLPKGTVAGIYSIPNHNHIDYMFSRHRGTKTYQTIFTILDKIRNANCTK